MDRRRALRGQRHLRWPTPRRPRHRCPAWRSTTPPTRAGRSTCPGRPPPTTSVSPATSSTAAPPRALTCCRTLGAVTSLHRRHGRHRHPLLLRGLRPRRGRQRGRQVAEVLGRGARQPGTGRAHGPCRPRGGTGQVALSWSANAEPDDLAGYNLYRDGVKVNGSPAHRHDASPTPAAPPPPPTPTASQRSTPTATRARSPRRCPPRPPRPATPRPPRCPQALRPAAARGRWRFPGPPTPSPTWPATTSTATGSRSTRAPLTATPSPTPAAPTAPPTPTGSRPSTPHGNESAQSAPSSATTAAAPPPPSDASTGFETGTDGATPRSRLDALRRPPARRVRQRAGQGRRAVRLDPGTDAAAYAGVCETASAGMTADGAEMRFWVYFDTTNQSATARRHAAPATAECSPFGSTRRQHRRLRRHEPHRHRLHHRRLHARSAPTRPAGPSSASSTTSPAQTYTLSKRASATDPWTQLKAAGAPATTSRSGARTPSPPPTALCSAPTRTPTCGSTTCAYADAASSDGDTTPPTAPAALARRRPPRRPGRRDRPVLGRRHRQRRRHRLPALPRHRAGRLRRADDARQRHQLHRRHRRDRHPLLLRGRRPRRRRQRVREVARGLSHGAGQPRAGRTLGPRRHRRHRPGLPLPGPPTPRATWPATTSTATASRSTPRPSPPRPSPTPAARPPPPTPTASLPSTPTATRARQSAPVSATTAAGTDTTPPAVPSVLAATGGTGQVSLYLVGQRRVRPGRLRPVSRRGQGQRTPITATCFTDTGRAAGTTYTYRLAAVDTHGNASAQSAAVSATTARPAAGPLDLRRTFETAPTGRASPPPGPLRCSAARRVRQRARQERARSPAGSRARARQPTRACETSTAGMIGERR